MAEADTLELKTYTGNSSSLYKAPEVSLCAVRSADSCYWGVLSAPMKMEQKVTTSGGKCQVDYLVDKRFDHLMTSYMTIEVPKIKVREEYSGQVRVAWCHNLPHNVTKDGTFIWNNSPCMKWDTVSLDQDLQVFKKKTPQSWEYLEKWRSGQSAMPLSVAHPWFYSTMTERGWPITGESYHRYNLRLKIKDLLRIQVKNAQGAWTPYTDGFISKYLELSDDATLDIPELWGRYSLRGPEEREWAKQCASSSSPEEPLVITQWFHTIIAADSDPGQYGQKLTVKLSQPNARVSSIMFSAENMEATRENNRSNYTTSIDSVHTGWNPISHVSLSYESSSGFVPKFEHLPALHFTGERLEDQFPGEAREAGHYAFSHAWDPDFYDADWTQQYNKLKPELSVWLADGSPDAEEMKEDEITGPKFKLRCRMRVVREWKIKYTKTGIEMEFGSC